MSANPPRQAVPLLPTGVDWWVALAVGLGLAVLYLPTFWDLSHIVWPTDEQGHGPIILVVSYWLIFSKRHELAALRVPQQPLLASGLLLFGLVLYAFGRSQSILLFEVGSQIPVLAALLLLFKGTRGLRLLWFPLLFLLFMVPLPEALVAAITGPLKTAVSAVASSLLFHMGYPVGRMGVIMTVGQYQLLVADACAGLNSIFTLEALGLLYMNLMAYKTPSRNVILAVLLVPIAFAANIVRVITLVLVTYYFGDEAGQGFVHGFAGMVLFMVALAIMILVDGVLGLFFKKPAKERP